MTFEELDEFQKDLKKLLKKYRTLEEDLATVKQILTVLPDQRPPFSFRIDGLGLETCVIKVKKIACKALKGKGVNSGLRLVYAYFKAADAGDDPEREEKIILIELYHKNDREGEDRARILRNFE